MAGERALLLDRDGVINVDHGYVHAPDRFDFVDGIFELCTAAQQRGYLLIVVTNQAGIGRGYYSEAQFHHLTDWMRERFSTQGITIHRVYFCPDHPEHGVGVYKRESPMRKPNPGMILAAAADCGLALDRSLLVGDKPSDIEAGRAAGVERNVLFDPRRTRPLSKGVVADLRDVVNLLDF